MMGGPEVLSVCQLLGPIGSLERAMSFAETQQLTKR